MKTLRMVLFAALCATVSPALSFAASWTHFFYIPGDYSYTGPTRADDEAVSIEDQAKQLFHKALKTAKADRENNYVIYYDPRGFGYPFTGKHVRLYVYQHGKKRFSNGWRVAETDSTKPARFSEIFSAARVALGEELAQSQKSFYFYGEHIASEKATLADLDARTGLFQRGSSPAGFRLQEFFEGLAQARDIGGLDLLVMQTCYMNTVRFLQEATTMAKVVLVPSGPILNTAVPIQKAYSRVSTSAEELASALVDAARSIARDYDWLMVGEKDSETLSLLSDLGKTPEAGLVREMLQSAAAMGELTETLSNSSGEARILPDSGEVIIPLNDYLDLLFRSGVDELALDKIEELLERDPGLRSRLSEVLQAGAAD